MCLVWFGSGVPLLAGVSSASCGCIPRRVQLVPVNHTGHNWGGTGDTTASRNKEPCFGFLALLRPRNTENTGHFNSTQGNGCERFSGGSFYSACHSCYKRYPKPAQVHIIASDLILRKLQDNNTLGADGQAEQKQQIKPFLLLLILDPITVQ